mmetsp:Transcript_6844/g.15656  ORF Transcript_6844/g.15656 Transcript_6844/m.15656 type:complete len:213 (-) Transcript_6844:2572-3210(-)
MSQRPLEAGHIPPSDLGDLVGIHRPLATASVRRKRHAADRLVHDDSIRPDIVGGTGLDGDNLGDDFLLAKWGALVLYYYRLGRVVKASLGVSRRSNRLTASDTKELPSVSEFADIMRSEVAMNETVLVHVKQRNSNTLENLCRERLSTPPHVQHEILRGGICTLHGYAVTGFRHRFAVSCVLDRVVYADDSGNVVTGKVIVLPNLELPLDDV